MGSLFFLAARFVDPTLEFFARLEVWNKFPRFVNTDFSGLRVTYISRLAVMVRECAKSSNFDSISRGEAVRHNFDDRVNGKVDIATRKLVESI